MKTTTTWIDIHPQAKGKKTTTTTTTIWINTKDNGFFPNSRVQVSTFQSKDK